MPFHRKENTALWPQLEKLAKRFCEKCKNWRLKHLFSKNGLDCNICLYQGIA